MPLVDKIINLTPIPIQTTLISLLCTALLFYPCAGSALDQDNQFIEIPSDVNILTFDLSTVHSIQPGRFTVVSTTIDQPDIMKLELKVLDTLQPYCAHPDGEYPAPADVLTLGPPDLPVESIKVKSSQSQLAGKTYPFKMVLWNYPYKRLTLDFKSGQRVPVIYIASSGSKHETSCILRRAPQS